MQIPSITYVFDEPTVSNSPLEFSFKAFAFVAALDPWAAQANAMAAAMNTVAATMTTQLASVAASATAASNSATAAGNSATSAGNSATAAGSSATAAGNSAAAAAASAAAIGPANLLRNGVTVGDDGNLNVNASALVGAGQTAAYPAASLKVIETAHATSNRAGISFGTGWYIAQDSVGDGVRDFFIYNQITAKTALKIGTDCSFKFGAAIGYETGGSVTQPISKSTGVTLHALTGLISMNNASMSSGSYVEFTLTNSMLSANDLLIARPAGYTGYSVEVSHFNSATEAVLRLINRGATRSDPVGIIFSVIRGAIA